MDCNNILNVIVITGMTSIIPWGKGSNTCVHVILLLMHLLDIEFIQGACPSSVIVGNSRIITIVRHLFPSTLSH